MPSDRASTDLAPVFRANRARPSLFHRQKAIIDLVDGSVRCIQCLWTAAGTGYALEMAAIFEGHRYHSIVLLGGPSSDAEGPVLADTLPPWLELEVGITFGQKLAQYYKAAFYCPALPSRQNEKPPWWERYPSFPFQLNLP